MSFRYRHEGWRKLYVREEGSFAQLPLYVRAIGGWLLKICDAAGRIACHGREPWAAIAWRGGATRGDRRMLKRDIPLLIEDGYLVLEPSGDVRIAAFLLAHPHLVEGVDRVAEPLPEPGADVHDLPPAQVEMPEPQTAPGSAGPQMGLFEWTPPAATAAPWWHTSRAVTPATTIEPRPGHDRATTEQREVAQVADTPQVVIEEKRREEKIQRETPPPGVAQAPVPESPAPRPTTSAMCGASAYDLARQIADEEEVLRFQVSCKHGLDHLEIPIGDVAQRIHHLLRAGWSAEALRRAMAAFAHEARKKRSLAYWNGVDNWKPAAIRRAIGRMPAVPARPAASATSPAVAGPHVPDTQTAPSTPEGDEMLDVLRAAWRLMGIDPSKVMRIEERWRGAG